MINSKLETGYKFDDNYEDDFICENALIEEKELIKKLRGDLYTKIGLSALYIILLVISLVIV